jgi:2-haloacid dehalogenase
MPLFPDVEPMLAQLRAIGCRLGVLTNCDEDLFEQTHRSFRQPFDLVVTAERVRDYKPSLSHFRFFARSTGAHKDNWVHVARSWHHDISPARELDLPRIWVDRENTGDDASAASVRVTSAVEICVAVASLRSTS